jgi:hypothetical protein
MKTVMMKMTGRRKLRRLLQHLLWPQARVRQYDPAWVL